MATYGDLIHAAIVSAISDREYYRIEYSGSETRSTVFDDIKPRSVKCDQRSSSFESARRNRQSRFRERIDWTWVADVHFDRAVSLEELEDDLSQNPLRIPRDPDDGRPQQVDIFLEEAEEYTHPVRKNGTTGTRVRYRFVAEMSPL